MSLEKSYLAVATSSRTGMSLNGKASDRSRPGTGTRASHILHIIGSFAGHEYEACLVFSFSDSACFLMTSYRDSDLSRKHSRVRYSE